MQKLKMNDEVIVLAGKEKGKKGKLKRIFSKQGRVVIEGINMVKKTVKPTQENPAGGITQKESPIHISNVALADPKTGKPTRVAIRVVDNKNVRVALKSGTVLN